jgi:hypothetical protein
MIIGLIIAGSVIALILSMVIFISNISDRKDLKRYDRGKINIKTSNKIIDRATKDVKKVLEGYSGKSIYFDSGIYGISGHSGISGCSGINGHSGIIGISGHIGDPWNWGDGKVNTTAAPTLRPPPPPPPRPQLSSSGRWSFE